MAQFAMATEPHSLNVLYLLACHSQQLSTKDKMFIWASTSSLQCEFCSMVDVSWSPPILLSHHTCYMEINFQYFANQQAKWNWTFEIEWALKPNRGKNPQSMSTILLLQVIYISYVEGNELRSFDCLTTHNVTLVGSILSVLKLLISSIPHLKNIIEIHQLGVCYIDIRHNLIMNLFLLHLFYIYVDGFMKLNKIQFIKKCIILCKLAIFLLI